MNRAPRTVAPTSALRSESSRSLVTTVTVRPAATRRAASATIASSPDASARTTRTPDAAPPAAFA